RLSVGPAGGDGLPRERNEVVVAGVGKRAKLRVEEGVDGGGPQHDGSGPRGDERPELLRRRGHLVGVHGAEGQADAGDGGAEVGRARRHGTISSGTSTKSRLASSQRNARASPGVRASDTTRYVTSG